ncbi:MAG TPA: PD-(D/E)XK nuclease family protein [Vicinamibacterales bacterium]|nr:PD-(D/E)XK nuclease family protein [Vicinamibacterales bacterium]
MVRIPRVTVWGKFDLAIVGGNVAPLEIIDWTFGRGRAANEAELRTALGTLIYRLIAGAHELELRPIAITEVHVPSNSVLTVTPTDEEVIGGWNRLKALAAEISASIDSGEFPARTGVHCSYCPYRASCPAVAAGSGVVPL